MPATKAQGGDFLSGTLDALSEAGRKSSAGEERIVGILSQLNADLNDAASGLQEVLGKEQNLGQSVEGFKDEFVGSERNPAAQ